jgi:hypothetical protein
LADGAYTDVVHAQQTLDQAVTTAYGWPEGTGQDARLSNAALLEMNRAVRAGELRYEGPG